MFLAAGMLPTLEHSKARGSEITQHPHHSLVLLHVRTLTHAHMIKDTMLVRSCGRVTAGKTDGTDMLRD